MIDVSYFWLQNSYSASDFVSYCLLIKFYSSAHLPLFLLDMSIITFLQILEGRSSGKEYFGNYNMSMQRILIMVHQAMQGVYCIHV